MPEPYFGGLRLEQFLVLRHKVTNACCGPSGDLSTSACRCTLGSPPEELGQGLDRSGIHQLIAWQASDGRLEFFASQNLQDPLHDRRLEERFPADEKIVLGDPIMMFVFIDPQVSLMTDDVVEGRLSDGRFRRAVTSLIGARFVGTLLAQFLFVPSAFLITRIAEAI